MNYTLDFGVVADRFGDLLFGCWLTIWLSLLAMAIALIIAVVGTLIQRTTSPALRPFRWLAKAYIEVVRNTPFVVQLFFIYFGLPSIGLRLDENAAALMALSINAGAYCVEIIRSGVDAIPKGQTDAAKALGLNRAQTFRFVIWRPALRTAYPALTSQFVYLLLESSIVSAISARELTYVISQLEAQTFRSFELYFTAAGLYLAMSLALLFLSSLVRRHFIDYPR